MHPVVRGPSGVLSAAVSEWWPLPFCMCDALAPPSPVLPVPSLYILHGWQPVLLRTHLPRPGPAAHCVRLLEACLAASLTCEPHLDYPVLRVMLKSAHCIPPHLLQQVHKSNADDRLRGQHGGVGRPGSCGVPGHQQLSVSACCYSQCCIAVTLRHHWLVVVACTRM
jgi:hypothetical protein